MVVEGVAAEGEDQVPPAGVGRFWTPPGRGGGCSGHPRPGSGAAPRVDRPDRAK